MHILSTAACLALVLVGAATVFASPIVSDSEVSNGHVAGEVVKVPGDELVRPPVPDKSMRVSYIFMFDEAECPSDKKAFKGFHKYLKQRKLADKVTIKQKGSTVCFISLETDLDSVAEIAKYENVKNAEPDRDLSLNGAGTSGN